MGGDVGARISHVTAVLGPTNTGKTHLAIERMLGHESGMIGLPLRLLAREVYDKIAKRVGPDKVALVTGEEKIKPKNASYWVSTVEAMPRDIDVAFLAIDEVQLAADPERGHIFTNRLLNARGTSETLLLGAQTMRDVIEDLVPGANFISRPRLSKLTYSGQKKITRLPKRTAIVAFSANEVYAIAELIRRQSGGAAVVLGALSPRTRNAQVSLYQSGDVDYLVATDAIGMGLNLDVDHVAFAAIRKFDGHNHRDLLPSELAQIAGRAGRHMNDGTFGVTGSVDPLDPELVERLESHEFEPVRVLQWRNDNLDFKNINRLKDSLRETSSHARLMRARTADDLEVLELACRDEEIVKLASSPAAVARLWDVCQVPDYRKISLQAHADLVSTLYKYLMGPSERIDEDWFEKQVAFAAKTDGDIDTLSNRIAHIRTWTFVSNRADWLRDPQHWQEKTRAIEDQLSDALHERLTQRFVDRRTSALMKGMRDKEELSADIAEDGAVNVEGHFVGRLSGFRFAPDTDADGVHGKATRSAAAQALSGELAMRVRRVVAAKADAFKLSRSGEILWRDMPIGSIEASDDPLKPTVTVIADEEYVAAADRENIRARLEAWLEGTIAERLKPLKDLARADDISGLAKGIAFRLVENFGILKREEVASEVKTLDQPARAQLRRHGVRFGAFNIYIPILLKPASAELAATLWAVKFGAEHGLKLEAQPEPPRPGLTSLAAKPETPEAFYRVYGYQVCGPRVVRLDMLERLSDQIRPLLAWRTKDDTAQEPPKGSTGDGGFTATPEMMSILGCSPEELGHVLKALGFESERRPVKPCAPTPATKTQETETQHTLATEPAPSTDECVATDTGTQPATAEATGEAETTDAPKAAPAKDESGNTDKSTKPESEPTASPPSSDDKTTTSATETAYQEIWRPKRRRPHDSRRARGRRHGQSRTQRSDAPPEKAQGDRDGAARHARRGTGADRTKPRGAGKDNGGKQGRKRAPAKRGKDQRPQTFQSKAPRKAKKMDPDSPFAALAALREEMTKPEQKTQSAKDKGQ